MKHLGFISTMVALVFLLVTLELTVGDYSSTLNKEHRSVIKKDSTFKYYQNLSVRIDSFYHNDVLRKNELYYENLFEKMIIKKSK